MRPLVIGALTVAGVALAAVGALAVVRGPGRAAREHALLLASAPGLREGGPVTYRGLDVGRIRTITLTDTGVLVTFGLERADLVLRAADSARLATQGLLGDKVVDILPGDHRAGALPTGAMLPCRSSTPSRSSSGTWRRAGTPLGARRRTPSRRHRPVWAP